MILKHLYMIMKLDKFQMETLLVKEVWMMKLSEQHHVELLKILI